MPEDTLGERIGRAITESRYKAKEVAQQIGITPQAVSKSIRYSTMGKDNLRKLADITGVETDWLINGKREDTIEFNAELMSKCIVAVENAAKELGMTGLDTTKVTHAALLLYKANQE